MQKLSLSVLAMAITSSTLPVYAEEAAEVVVTASRKAQSVDETTASVTVITREDLDTSQARDVMEVLRLQAGVEVARSGGAGTGTSVFMRGTNSNQVLVLVDGVRVSSGTTGAFAWETLSPDQIERIEIVRGPMASIYGSDAIGGVISITTRKAGEDSITVLGGSYQTHQLSGTYSTGDDKESFAMSFNSQQSVGFSASNSKSPSYTYNSDLDGYNTMGFSGRYQKNISDKTRFVTSFWSNVGRSDYDSGANMAYSRTQNSALNIGLQTQVSDNHIRTLRIGYATDQVNDVSDYASDIGTQRISLTWQNDIQHSKTSFSVYGLDYHQNHAMNIDLSPLPATEVFNHTDDNLGLFWVWNRKRDNKTLQISLRGDHHDTFGFHPSGSIAWANKLSDKNRISLSLGSAFRAPTFNELYYPGWGNTALQPESSLNIEFGLRHHIDQKRGWSINLFYNDVTNLITTDPDTGFAGNVNHAAIPGMEFVYSKRSDRWHNAINLTLQNPHDADTGEALTRRAPAILSIQNNRKLKKGGNISSEIIWSSSRSDYDYNSYPATPVTLPAYLLWNMSANFPLSKTAKLSLRVENILDYQYEYAYGYNTAGRSFYLGYQYKL